MIRPQRDPRASLLQHQRKGRVAVGGGGRDAAGDDALDLFSNNRRSAPVAVDEPDRRHAGSIKPGGSGSVESAKLPRGGIDDLLSGSDIGKHDYDWLLTPPGTPLRSSVDSNDHKLITAAPRSNLPARSSISTTKSSRFSLSQPENNQPHKPARSNSATRSAISAYSSHFSSNSNKTSALNTSTASVTSCRPSTPTRSSTPSRRSTSSTPTSTSVSKQTIPTSRPGSSRPSTPSKSRSYLTSPGDKSRNTQAPSEKPRPLYGSRPSTPTSRPQISSSSSYHASSVTRSQAPASSYSIPNSSVTRSSSRPSTPTRRTTTKSAPAARSSSVGRVPSMNTRNPGPPSRPSSPGPRTRSTVHPIALPDFSLNAPPNLRTKVPERPLSTGRTRPGTALTVRANMNSEPPLATNPPRRQSSSPIVTRGRFPENSPRARAHINGQSTPPETQRIPSLDGSLKKSAKTSGTLESTGFGRTISKKSLDMALRHMDIGQNMGNIRAASLFPQSVRSASKSHVSRKSDSLVYPSVRSGNDPEDVYCNGTISGSGSANDGFSENGDGIANSPDGPFLIGRAATVPDVFESSRYDAILLKEDSKNMNWLHSIDDDKSDQGLVFDHRFEPPPEPFGLM